MASIDELWPRWRAWLEREAPRLIDGLGGPATDAEIAAAAEALGGLPKGLEALYRVHDGAAAIVGGYDIVTLEDLGEAREMWEDEGEVWPFVDHGSGDWYAVDGSGRVIELVHDDDGGDVLADSVEHWMEQIVTDLERGYYQWNEASQMFEPETLGTGFRWLSTIDGRRNALVLEPGAVSAALEVGGGAGVELISLASLADPSPDAMLRVERDGERVFESAIAELAPGDDSGPGERDLEVRVAGPAAVSIANCDQRYYLFHQRYDIAADRLERGVATLRRLTSVGEIEPVLEQIAALLEMGFDADPELANDFWTACARSAVELSTGGSVFDASRLVQAVLGAVAVVGGHPSKQWHFARAAVDVAVEANDPELVGQISDELIGALDLAAVADRLEAPEAVAALYNLACLHARFGDKAGCMRFAELALERRVVPSELRDDPDFEPLAHDPDFVALLERFRPDHDTDALYLIVTGTDRQSGPVEVAEGELRNDRDAADDDRFFIHAVGDVFYAIDGLRERAALLWPARVHADSDLVRDDSWARYVVDVVDVEPALSLATAEAWDLLFDSGLEPGAGALEWPAKNGWTEAVRVMCDRGAAADAEALFFAAYNGHADVAALLIERGADAAEATIRAIEFNSLAGVQLLERAGADLSAVGSEVLAEAEAKDLSEVVDYIRSRA